MSTQNSVPGKGAGQIVADARKTIPEITVVQARQEWEQGQVALLLEVREPAEWEKGHIRGAILAPRGLLEWYADPTTPYAKPELTTKRDAHIIIACASGGSNAPVDGLHRCGEHIRYVAPVFSTPFSPLHSTRLRTPWLTILPMVLTGGKRESEQNRYDSSIRKESRCWQLVLAALLYTGAALIFLRKGMRTIWRWSALVGIVLLGLPLIGWLGVFFGGQWGLAMIVVIGGLSTVVSAMWWQPPTSQGTES